MRKAVGRRRSAGFTLIEVMIVILIVLALSGLVGVALFQRQKEAKVQLAQIQMNEIQSALKQFYLVFDRWPTEDEGIAVLWDKERLDPESDASKWSMFMDRKIPTDRWGNEWGYRFPSEHAGEDAYDLWSNGPDGEPDTDDDLVSWEKEDDSALDSGGPSGSG